jgi:hypothetical protein
MSVTKKAIWEEKESLAIPAPYSGGGGVCTGPDLKKENPKTLNK